MSSVVRSLAVLGLMSLAACQTNPSRPDAATQSSTSNAAATQRANTAPQQPAASSQNTAGTTPKITFLLAQTSPANGLARIQLGKDANLYAVPQPVFTQADLQGITPIQTKDGKVFLRFDFTQQGKVKLANITSKAIGNYLIISANGKLIGVPKINAAYQQGQFPLPMQSVEQARETLQIGRQPAQK